MKLPGDLCLLDFSSGIYAVQYCRRVDRQCWMKKDSITLLVFVSRDERRALGFALSATHAGFINMQAHDHIYG